MFIKASLFPSTKSSFRLQNPAALFHISILIFIAILFGLFSTNANAAQVKVTFDPSPDSRAIGHKIYYSQSSDISKTKFTEKIDLGTDIFYVTPQLQEGTTYYFAATAYDIHGNESIFSEIASYKVPVTIYTIGASAGTGGSISPAGNIAVAHGAGQKFTMTPNTGQKIKDVLVNGKSVGAVSTYTFSNVTSNQTISVSFEALVNNPGWLDTYMEDFQNYSAGNDPDGWFDTGANNSMIKDDRLFKIYDLSNNNVFGTSSTLSNIHSHYIDPTFADLSSFEYTGRMMRTSSTGGVGVTFLSNYPLTDAYYRLRAYDNFSFHIAPHPQNTAKIFGTTDSGIIPQVNQWYKFRIKVSDTGTRTEILAKVWKESDSEPAQWQINAYDDTSNRRVSGTFGVWGHRNGAKYWDDLKISVSFETVTYTIGASAGTGGSISPAGNIAVAHGAGQKFTMTPNSGQKIKDVLVNGKSVGAVSTYTFSNVTSNQTISVSFETITYTIGASAGTGGSISPAGNIAVAHGAGQKFTMTPNTGQKIKDVLVNGKSVGAVSTYTFSNVTSNQTISVSFEALVNNPGWLDTYMEDFQNYSAGNDPANWFDTGADNSMIKDDRLFKIYNLSYNNVFGTSSTLRNIHSHYIDPTFADLSSFEYTGRMMRTNSAGGVGVTFLSNYPVSDAYYRLRAYGNYSFHIAPHPQDTAKIFGTTDSGVIPLANQWYRFRIKVSDTGTRTEILAKVWKESDSEPAQWQINAYDDTSNRRVSGTFGVWGHRDGAKYWDDLKIISTNLASTQSVNQDYNFMEMGEVAINHIWKRESFNQPFLDPVVIAKPASSNDPNPAVVRIRNVDGTGFEIKLQEWNNHDYFREYETVDYLVVEKGSYVLPGEIMMEAGTFETDGQNFQNTSFIDSYKYKPVVIASVTSFNQEIAVDGRIDNVSLKGFEYRLQEHELNSRLEHGVETVSFIAIEPFSGTLNGLAIEAGTTGAKVNHDVHYLPYTENYLTVPYFLADMQTTNDLVTSNVRYRNKDHYGVEIHISKEQSQDTELMQANENIGYIIIAK
jgi:hypothetical protein